MGYKGPLCALCEEGYGIKSRHQCEKCTNRFFILKMAGFLLMQLGFMAFAMYKSLKICRSLFLNNVDEKDAITMNLIKIFSSHAQLLVIIFSLDGSSYNFLSIFESNPFNTNISDNFSIKCLFKAFNIELYYLYSKIGITLLSPLVCFIVAVLVLKIKMIKHHDSFHQNRPQNMEKRRLVFFDLIESVIFIVCAMHSPNIIRDILEMFIFINIEDDQYPQDLRVLADVEIVFDSNMHLNALYFLAIPLLFIFALLLPFLIVFQIKKKKEAGLLNDQIVRFNYGYFFFSYKEDKLYWEFISNLRKVVIQGIVVAGSSLDSKRKNICFLSILSMLMIFLYIIKENKPYKMEYKVLNKIEEGSFFTLIVSSLLLIGFNFYDQIDDSISNNENSSSNIFFMILILINGVYYSFFIFFYVKYGKLEEQILRFLPLKARKSRIFERFEGFMKSLSLSSQGARKSKKLMNYLNSSKKDKLYLKEKNPKSILRIFDQDASYTFFPYLKKILKKMAILKMKNTVLRLEVVSLKGEQLNSCKNKILTQVLPLTENSYLMFYERESIKLKMKFKMISFSVKYAVKIAIKETKINKINLSLHNQTKQEVLLLFSKLILLNLIKILNR